MKKKISWGTGILITFILFTASVLIQVLFYMRTDVDLVTDNYYEKELSYDEHIERINNTDALPNDLNIEYARDTIIIRFPAEYKNDKISGYLRFYRPSDSSRDLVMKIRPDKECNQIIPASELISGYWKIQINWEYGDRSFYSEKTVMIN